MRQPLLHQQWFYLPYIVVMVVCGYFVIQFTKADIHIWLNQRHSVCFDVFFKYLTYLGDGSLLPLYIVIMLMIRFRGVLLLVVVFLLSGLFTQLLKRLVFEDMARPIKYFEGNYHLHLVQGVKQYCCNSFPSGHSATAFGVFFCLALIARQNWLKLLMFILAGLVAYSRVYLSQHFLVDIMAGSFVGLLTAVFCYPWIYSINKTWLDESLITITRKRTQ
jgi:membrane-associated phospholipid phosphatase